MRAPHFFSARSCGRDGAKMIRRVHVGARSSLGLWACTGSKQLRERASHHTLWPNRNKSSTLSPRSALLATGMALLISKLRARSTRWACTAGRLYFISERASALFWLREDGRRLLCFQAWPRRRQHANKVAARTQPASRGCLRHISKVQHFEEPPAAGVAVIRVRHQLAASLFSQAFKAKCRESKHLGQKSKFSLPWY